MTNAALLLGFLAVAGPVARFGAAKPPQQVRIDHVLLGAPDLDSAVKEFERLTGVRATYGGKHPGGTHNALVSLGSGTYLELIAPQPGAEPASPFSALARFKRLTPLGWAVSASDGEHLRQLLQASGFAVTAPRPGSRTTPAGTTLRWDTFTLESPVDGAPFFISWSADSPHPSATAPAGCKLDMLTVFAPATEPLERLRSTLALTFDVALAPAKRLAISLTCPKGKADFDGLPPQRQ